MRLLASFAMRGQFQAILSISVLALLSLVMPIVGLLNTGIIALVTLSQGYKDGFKILLPSTLIVGLLGGVMLGQPWVVLGMTIPLWIMVWLFSSFWGLTGSLRQMMVAILGVSGLLILYLHLSFDDPVAYWSKLLVPLTSNFEAQGLLKAEQLTFLVEQLSRWMAAIVAIGFFLQMMLSTLLGYWWYATLYKPGKFAEEFQALCLPRWLSAITIACILFSQVQSGSDVYLVQYFVLLLLSAFLFSGLALFHFLMKNVQRKLGWVFVLYALLFLFPSSTALALASVGIMDAWINSRTRINSSLGE